MEQATRGWGEKGSLFSLFLPLQPVPASRPKLRVIGKFAQAYYPTKHKEYVAAAKDLLPAPPECYRAPERVWVSLEFRFRRARTSKLLDPVPDVDNLVKLILDILTDIGYWPDDKRVVGITASKRFATDTEAEGTRIALYVDP